MKRRRSVPHTFEENIAAEKVRCAEQLANAPLGPQRDALLRKIRQLETASHMNDWLRSSELKPPAFNLAGAVDQCTQPFDSKHVKED
jgi:hypothetical protein